MHVLAELQGRATFKAPAGDFTLTAKADRIEVFPDKSINIVDYKTGEPPSGTQVVIGFSPQLTLEGAIALQGGFPGLDAQEVKSVVYVSLKGGEDGGEYGFRLETVTVGKDDDGDIETTCVVVYTDSSRASVAVTKGPSGARHKLILKEHETMLA
jgi:hypothetical protein